MPLPSSPISHPPRTSSRPPPSSSIPISQKQLPRIPSSTSSNPSPGTSETANVKRSRSIQFQPISSPSNKSPLAGPWSPPSREAMQDQDMGETTPIISSERGGGRDYRAFEPLGPPATTEGAVSKRGSEASLRRRGQGSRSRSEGEREEAVEEESWWKGVVDKYGSVELDNKGSVARDHLALERTFLAWLRTSLAFASIGIAVTQLFRLNTTISQGEGLTPVPSDPGTIKLRQVGKPLGATFLAIAILVLVIGGRRYFESQYWIIRGKFPASRGSICLITLVAVALIVTSLVVVVTVNPTQFQGN